MERSSFIKTLKAKKYFSYSSDEETMYFRCGDVQIKIFKDKNVDVFMISSEGKGIPLSFSSVKGIHREITYLGMYIVIKLNSRNWRFKV